jgi:hypothetical protein
MEAASSFTPVTDGSLTSRDEQVLAFERQWWRYPGAKESAIKEHFDLTPARYYQLLNDLIDRPAAMTFDPMLVKRLRRMRESRQKARSARRLGFDI